MLHKHDMYRIQNMASGILAFRAYVWIKTSKFNVFGKVNPAHYMVTNSYNNHKEACFYVLDFNMNQIKSK